MLKGINGVLTPDLLHALAAMGHDDEIAIVDANYPAASSAQRLVTLPTVSTIDAVDAVLSLMPLDDFDDCAMWCMGVVGDPDRKEPIFDEVCNVVSRHEEVRSLGKLERHAFYKRAAEAFVIVKTGERRLYGNFIFRKGVVRS